MCTASRNGRETAAWCGKDLTGTRPWPYDFFEEPGPATCGHCIRAGANGTYVPPATDPRAIALREIVLDTGAHLSENDIAKILTAVAETR